MFMLTALKPMSGVQTVHDEVGSTTDSSTVWVPTGQFVRRARFHIALSASRLKLRHHVQ